MTTPLLIKSAQRHSSEIVKIRVLPVILLKETKSINKASKHMEMSVANQKDISGSRRPNFAHRQVLFANGTNNLTDKVHVN